MAEHSKIEWTDSSWNFIRGCSRVSAGCENCYAETIAKRFSGEGLPYADTISERGKWNGNITFHEDILLKPLFWKKPRKIFVNSMSDLFHENVKNEWLDKAFAVMALTPYHTYQVLTKRPERMLEYMTAPDWKARIAYKMGEIAGLDKFNKFRDAGLVISELMVNNAWSMTNVWLGVSVEDQKTADERIPLLLETPAAVRWLSMEPLLGPVGIFPDYTGQKPFDEIIDPLTGLPMSREFRCRLDWVVVGGESGGNARPMQIEWVRSLKDQCQAADVPFFFKQGSQANWPKFKDFDGFPSEFQIREFPDV